jgi:hypothetical protein
MTDDPTPEEIKKLAAELAAMRSRLRSSSDPTPVDQFDALRKEIAILNEKLKAGGASKWEQTGDGRPAV